MLICPECDKRNPKESKYCGACGASLEGYLLQSIDPKNSVLIADGYQLLHQKRVEEAFMLAQVCLKADPYYKHAWSLLGDCHQVQGRLVDALTCYEKAADLDPDGHLDRLKIRFLRQQFPGAGTSSSSFSMQRKRFALSIAVFSSVLVCFIGIFFLFSRQLAQVSKPRSSKGHEMAHNVDLEPFEPSQPYHTPPSYQEMVSPGTAPTAPVMDPPSSQSPSSPVVSASSLAPTPPLPQTSPPLPLPLAAPSLPAEQASPSNPPIQPIAPLPPNMKLVPITPKPEEQETKPEQKAEERPVPAGKVVEAKEKAPTKDSQVSEAPKPSVPESVIEIQASEEDSGL
jgi:hypothetical protein